MLHLSGFNKYIQLTQISQLESRVSRMADTGESGAAETATPPAAESASGSGTAIMSTIGAHPSITIFTFWQGILEIVVRAIGIVS